MLRAYKKIAKQKELPSINNSNITYLSVKENSASYYTLYGLMNVLSCRSKAARYRDIMCSVLCTHIIAHTPRNPQYLFSFFLKNIFYQSFFSIIRGYSKVCYLYIYIFFFYGYCIIPSIYSI